MGIRVYWGDERQTLVCYEFNGAWSWDDLHFAVRQAAVLQRTVTHRVDVIFDMRESGRIPANPMGNFRVVAEGQPPNVALGVFIPLKRFLVALLEALAKFSPAMQQYYRIAETWDDAVKMIDHDRTEYKPVLNSQGTSQLGGISA